MKSGQTCSIGSPLTHVNCALRIGAWPVNAGQSFYGIIDEVAIYGTALSAAEIEQRYEEGGGGQPPTYPPPEANVTYTSSFDGTRYTYYLTVENTSEGPYDIYFLIFGNHCDVPYVKTFADTSNVNSPD